MNICILGGGWYGCHLALALSRSGHCVELHEISDRLFSGASGGNPARLHLGPHYPRSKLTRAFCQEHHAKFMRFTGISRSVPVNIYAIAEADSLVDFGTYVQVLRGEIEFIVLERPAEFGLRSIEGAILTGERHIVIEEARSYFERELGNLVQYQVPSINYRSLDHPYAHGLFDWTIDCTFCANDSAGIQRYEPCVTALVEGPVHRAVTIMDGPFPSLYPWNEAEQLSSVTSARYTPLWRFESYDEAADLLKHVTRANVENQCGKMLEQLAEYWPESRQQYKWVDAKLSIRAMPRSGADARLVDVVQVGQRMLRVRAGKIDAVLHAEKLIKELIHG